MSDVRAVVVVVVGVVVAAGAQVRETVSLMRFLRAAGKRFDPIRSDLIAIDLCAIVARAN